MEATLTEVGTLSVGKLETPIAEGQPLEGFVSPAETLT